MQLIIKHSKFLIVAMLTCVLGSIFVNDFIKHSGSNMATNSDEIIGSGSAYTSHQKPVASHAESIWTTMSQEFNLDHRTQSAQVKAEIRKILADREKLDKILKSAGPYIYFIYSQTRAKGLPAELALIPIIESEFNPNDHSKQGALGLWQLMPQTAHELGVKIKASYDGRRNVIASTKAALAYFNDLGNLFKGNWLLAIAAYNCGQMRVASAERQVGSHSFWNLPLPKETQYYVPKLLAVAAIIKNPRKYGVQLPQVNNEPYFTELKVKKQVNLTKIAESTGIKIETLNTLNPDYKKGTIIPTQKGTTSLLVPIKKASTVKAHLANNIVSI